MKTIWFFDLEKTMIESWVNPIICNQSNLISFIEKNKIEEIHIFSAAIWCEENRTIFENQLRSKLSLAFNINIVSWISMEDVWKQSSFKHDKFNSVCEMEHKIGKNKMFEDWCMTNLSENSHAILIDDSFGNTICKNDKKNIITQIIDVADLDSFKIEKINYNKNLKGKQMKNNEKEQSEN